MPFIKFLTAALIVTVLLRTGTHAAAQNPPNIVVFIADDLGWNDVGYHGSEIATPTLDLMARDGLEFDSFYAFPWCSSTRAGFEMGMNPARFGIRSLQHNFEDKRVIPKSVGTLPEALKKHNYKSFMIGKWHLSRTFAGGPMERGYDGAFGYLYGQIDHVAHEDAWGTPSLFRDSAPITAKGHMTDLIAAESKRILSQVARPFFLNIRYSAPHYPLQATEAFKKQYAHLKDPDRRLYAAMVSHMDNSIGEIIEHVRAIGQFDNTLFFFFSDNGGQKYWPEDIVLEGAKRKIRRYGGKFGPYSNMANNDPLRGFKTGVYEGGIRVPAVAYAPSMIDKGISSSFVTVLDFFPTFLSLLGEKASRNLEGIDFGPLFKSKPIDRKVEFYWLTNSVTIPFGGGEQDAVRVSDWKLVETQKRYRWFPHRFRWPFDKVELFNIKTDPYEKTDLAAQHPEIVEQLQEKLDVYRANSYFAYTQ